MHKWINLLLILLSTLMLTISSACQAADKKQDAPPVNPPISTTQSSNPADSKDNKDSAWQGSQIVPSALVIWEVNVTSPSRPPVTVYPASSKPSDNSTVSARVWETLDFECVAADQAGHKLTYTWSCSAGKLRGEGSKVIWTAPGAGGDYSVTVSVSCDKGENAILPIKLLVKCCSD
jgi:hypothetical protein